MERHLRERKKPARVKVKAGKKAGDTLPSFADTSASTLLNTVLIRMERDPYFRTGYLYQTAGNYSAAATCYSQSIQHNPSAEAHTFLGHILSLMGDLDGAISQAKVASELNPEFSLAWNDLGNYMVDKHAYEEALNCFKRALECKNVSGKSVIYYNMARAYVAKGHMRAASDSLNKSIALDPAFENAQFLREELARTVH